MTPKDSENAPRRTLSLKRDSANARIEERLHKVLAQAGLGSRRALEERISNGQVKVNGEIATLGSSVKGGDRIELDGKVFVASALTEAARVLMYHKPEGEVTTREDPEGRTTVFEQLPPLKGARWIAVGRLDINTTGLLLLTTDGDLANALMHPSAEVKREYVCRIHGEVDEEIASRLARGIELEDGPAKFDEIERIGSSDSHAWFRVVLHEGRNREVRRMWEAVGFQVSRLKRTRYGEIELPRGLKRGQCEELPAATVEAMRQSLKLDAVGGVLTLQPVIGQRRAAKTAEFKPLKHEQRAWTNGGYADEGRELRAFDTLRDDRPARPGSKSRFGAKPAGGKPGGRGGKPGGGGAGRRGSARPGTGGDDNRGNRLTAPGGEQRGPNRRRGATGPAPGFENPTEFRSWYAPEGVTTTSRVAPPRNQAKPGGRPDGSPYGGKPGGRADGNPYGGKPSGPRPGGAPGGKPAGGPGGYKGSSGRGPAGAGSRGPAGPGGNRGPGGGGGRGPGGPAGGGARPGPRSNKPRGGGGGGGGGRGPGRGA